MGNNMKKFILLFLVMVTMSSCLYTTYRTPYYQRYSRYQQRYKPGKIYKPYFRPGRF